MDDAMPYIVFGLLLICVILGFCMTIVPVWGVWASRKQGQADLAEAQYEQQIQVARAQARKDAATLNKEAAIIEAQAVAAQIKEIGEGLTQHELYLRWQWIRMMEDRKGSTIYVPTEANLPILEASRRKFPTPETQP